MIRIVEWGMNSRGDVSPYCMLIHLGYKPESFGIDVAAVRAERAKSKKYKLPAASVELVLKNGTRRRVYGRLQGTKLDQFHVYRPPIGNWPHSILLPQHPANNDDVCVKRSASVDCSTFRVNDPSDEAWLMSDKIAANRTKRRRTITTETKGIHCKCTLACYGGICPCCGEVRVVNQDGTPTERAHFDHATDDSAKIRPSETWLVCDTCNLRFNADPAYRHEHYGTSFASYQKKLARMLETPRPEAA